MKITTSQLSKLISEELESVLKEEEKFEMDWTSGGYSAAQEGGATAEMGRRFQEQKRWRERAIRDFNELVVRTEDALTDRHPCEINATYVSRLLARLQSAYKRVTKPYWVSIPGRSDKGMLPKLEGSKRRELRDHIIRLRKLTIEKSNECAQDLAMGYKPKSDYERGEGKKVEVDVTEPKDKKAARKRRKRKGRGRSRYYLEGCRVLPDLYGGSDASPGADCDELYKRFYKDIDAYGLQRTLGRKDKQFGPKHRRAFRMLSAEIQGGHAPAAVQPKPQAALPPISDIDMKRMANGEEPKSTALRKLGSKKRTDTGAYRWTATDPRLARKIKFGPGA